MKTKIDWLFGIMLFLLLGVLLGCEQAISVSSNSDGNKFEATSSIPIFLSGDIYKFPHGEDAEYLSFSTGTTGTYYYYKDGTLKSSESFIYSTSTGQLTLDSNTKSSNYIVKTNNLIYTTTSRYFTPVSGSGLYRSWTDGIATISFNNNGSFSGSGNGFNMTGNFTVSNSIVTVNYTQVSPSGETENDTINLLYALDKLYVKPVEIIKVLVVGN
jgi:hypothetical protein